MPTLTFSAWSHQALALRTKCKNIQMICGRRAGKTWTAVMVMLLRALQQTGATIWWVGLSTEQVEVAEIACRYFLEQVPGCHWSAGKRRWRLPNGSTVTFKSMGSNRNLRGWGLDGLVVDEAAFVDEEVWETDLSPSLMDNDGWCILCSTPNGFNWFEKWQRDTREDSTWLQLEYPSWVSPKMPRWRVEKKKAVMSESAWNQEYAGRFVAKGKSIFLESYFEEILVKQLPKSFQRSAIGVDLSEGDIQSDYQAICCLGSNEGHHYLDVSNYRLPIPALLQHLVKKSDLYCPEIVVLDASGGYAIVEHEVDRAFHGHRKPQIIYRKLIASKESRIQTLGGPYHTGLVHVLDNEGGREYVREARDWPVGKFDDLLDAHCLAWEGLSATQMAY